MELIGKTHRQLITINKEVGHLYVPSINARIMDQDGGYFFKTNSAGFRSNIEFKKKKKKLEYSFLETLILLEMVLLMNLDFLIY